MEISNTTATKFPHYCPSNACMEIFPENKPQHYKIQLNSPYKLDGTWQVALHSISYPHSWYNLPKTAIHYGIQLYKDGPNENKGIVECWLYLERGQYESAASLLTEINDKLNKSARVNGTFVTGADNPEADEKYFDLKVTESNPQKVELFTSRKGNYIYLLKEWWDIWGILGFEKSNINNELIKRGDKSKFPASINLHMPAMYIYLPNLVKGVGVGESTSPLLATIPIMGKLNEIVHIEPNNLVFIDLIQNYIKMIEIIIKDDRGNNLDFILGKINITLLFRRIN